MWVIILYIIRILISCFMLSFLTALEKCSFHFKIFKFVFKFLCASSSWFQFLFSKWSIRIQINTTRIRLLWIVFCKIIWEVVALCWGDVLDRWYKAFQITEAGVPGSNRVATVSQLDITLKTGKVTMWV